MGKRFLRERPPATAQKRRRRGQPRGAKRPRGGAAGREEQGAAGKRARVAELAERYRELASAPDAQAPAPELQAMFRRLQRTERPLSESRLRRYEGRVREALKQRLSSSLPDDDGGGGGGPTRAVAFDSKGPGVWPEVEADRPLALHQAIRARNSGLVTFLLRNLADPAERDPRTGNNALHACVLTEFTAPVPQLLTVGGRALLEARNSQGLTPTDLAERRGVKLAAAEAAAAPDVNVMMLRLLQELVAERRAAAAAGRPPPGPAWSLRTVALAVLLALAVGLTVMVAAETREVALSEERTRVNLEREDAVRMYPQLCEYKGMSTARRAARMLATYSEDGHLLGDRECQRLRGLMQINVDDVARVHMSVVSRKAAEALNHFVHELSLKSYAALAAAGSLVRW